MGVDPTGEWVHLLVGAVVGAVVGGITSAVNSYKQSGSVDIGSALLGAATGAVSGLVGASGLGAGAQALVSGVIGGVSELYDAHKNGRDVNALDVVMGVAIGATSSLIGSAATRGMVNSSKTLINKGINKIVSGKAKFDSGGRYWKGSIKRGLQYFNEGIKSLHIAQGKSSVIGSISGGTLSLAKPASLIKNNQINEKNHLFYKTEL